MAAIDRLLDELEFSARADAEVSTEGALTSIAISLKRIADLLDSITTPPERDGYSVNVRRT